MKPNLNIFALIYTQREKHTYTVKTGLLTKLHQISDESLGW